MEVNTTPNPERGEALLTIGGEPRLLKFNLRTLYAWTQLTGKAPSQFAETLDENHIGALSSLLLCAVRLAVPGQEQFTQEQAIDLIQGLNPEEAEQLAAGIIEAVTPDPLLAALRKQIAAKAAQRKAANESGAETSNLASAS